MDGPPPPAQAHAAGLLESLHDDDLEVVLLRTDTPSLARLASTCTKLRAMLAEPSLLRRLVHVRGFSPGRAPADADEDTAAGRAPHFHLSADVVDSLEGLAILEALRAEPLGGSHLVFHLASLSMVSESKELLSRYAELLRRHPRLTVRIDSHTGVGAPSRIHASHSVRRAVVAARALAAHDVSMERISACAWGYRVARQHDWPPTTKYARCELFLTLPAARNALGPVVAPTPVATTAPAVAPEASEPEAGPQPQRPQFDRSRCAPSWPPYYEGVTPTKDLWTVCEEADSEDDLAGVESDYSSDDEPGPGGHFINPILHHLHGLFGGANGPQLNGVPIGIHDFVALLQQQHGAGVVPGIAGFPADSDNDEDSNPASDGGGGSDDDDQDYQPTSPHHSPDGGHGDHSQ